MSTDAQKKLGERIRDRRLALGLTQEQLAARAGLTAVHVGRVEHGEPDVSVSTIEKIAAALNTTPGDLLGGVIELSPKAIAFGKAFDDASPELQAAILSFLSTLHRVRGQA